MLTKTSQLCATGGQQAVLGDELQSTPWGGGGGASPREITSKFWGEKMSVLKCFSAHTEQHTQKSVPKLRECLLPGH